jgi:hypothetical protein
MRFYDVPVNRSVPTEVNRGLTSYIAMMGFIVCGVLFNLLAISGSP